MTWKKGQSGNPKGRPPAGDAWAEILREMGEEIYEDGRARREKVCEQLFRMAEDGDMRAIQLIIERVEGKPTVRQEIDHTSLGQPINANVRFIREIPARGNPALNPPEE